MSFLQPESLAGGGSQQEDTWGCRQVGREQQLLPRAGRDAEALPLQPGDILAQDITSQLGLPNNTLLQLTRSACAMGS